MDYSNENLMESQEIIKQETLLFNNLLEVMFIVLQNCQNTLSIRIEIDIQKIILVHIIRMNI